MSLENKGSMATTVMVSRAPDRSGNFVVENDGETFTKMQAAIDAAEILGGGTHGATVHIKGGTYSLPTIPLTIDTDYIRITGDYPIITIPNATMSAANYAIFKVESSHVEIDHLIIDGNGVNQSYTPTWATEEALISIYKFRWNSADIKTTSREEDVKIHHNIIRNAYVTHICSNKYDKVKIHDNNIYDRHYLTSGKNVLIMWGEYPEVKDNYMRIYTAVDSNSNNIMFFNGAAATDQDYSCKYGWIKGNTVENCVDSPIEINGYDGAGSISVERGHIITDNTVIGRSIIVRDSLEHILIADNLIYMIGDGDTANAGITVEGGATAGGTVVRDIVVQGNTVSRLSGNGAYRGIQVVSNDGPMTDINIVDNEVCRMITGVEAIRGAILINGNNRTGADLLTRVTVKLNKVHHTGSHGIYIMDTDQAGKFTIENNEVYNNGQDSTATNDSGIYVVDPGDFLIRHNTFYDDQTVVTQERGITVTGNCLDGVIEFNRFDEQLVRGVTFTAGSNGWTIMRNNFTGTTTPIVDGGATGIIYDTKEFPFVKEVNGAFLVTSPCGIEITLAAEGAVALGRIPDHATQTRRITVEGVGLTAPGAAAAMMLTIALNAGKWVGHEAFNAEAISVTKENNEDNFAVNDIIQWELTATDDSDVDDMEGGESFDCVVTFAAASAPDIETDAIVRTVTIHYV